MSSYQGNILIKNPATPTGPAEDGTAPGIWKLNEALAFVKQGIWPTQGVQGRDPYFPYVSLLLSTTALGNANNNLFVDSSGAFNPISRNGNTTQGSVTPYSASWSNYFDGSGDYLDAASNAAFGLGTGDFTIEMWVFPTANPTNGPGTIFDLRSGPTASATVSRINSSLQLLLYNGPAGTEFVTGSVALNVWTHVAFVRASGSVRTYINGTLSNTTTVTSDLGSSQPCYIGTNRTAGYEFNGNISNFRIVKGTAVYTSNFTVPTAPLTAISGTSILTCQSNRFRDASANNFTITVTGNTRTTEFSPFAPASPGITYNQSDITNWSGYFDGSGDYLNAGSNSAFALGTGDFTIECWFYQTAAAGNQILISTDITNGFYLGWDVGNFNFGIRGIASILSYSPSNQNLNQWNHVVVSRSGSTNSMFWNGTRVATTSDTYNFSITGPLIIGGLPALSGYYWNGYISNVRVVKGTAVYNPSSTTITVPTSSLTAISGTSLLTCQNAAFTDNSTNNFVITQFGNTATIGNSPFGPTGYWSIAGTTGQGATIPQTTATDLGSGSFTVECWVNISDYSGSSILTKRRTDTALTGSWGIFLDASGFMNFQGVGWASSYTATTNAVPRNRWTHLAVSRSGTNLSMFVNGVRVYNVTDSYNYTCSTYTIIKLGGNSGGNYPSGSALSFGFVGAISNVRIVQSAAVYDPASTSFTVPTSPLTAVSGTSLLTCQNGTMKDNSTNNNTSILLYGGGSIQSFDPFYTATIASNGGSMYLDGTGDYLRSNIPSLNIRAPFTIEGWAYLSTVTNFVFFSGSTTAGAAGQALYLNELSGLVYFGDGVTNNISFSNSLLPINSWAHIACTFDGTTYRVFINGTSAGSSTSLLTNYTLNSIDVGARLVSVTNYATGYISNFRITGGTALYTATFTPPTAPLTPSANTNLLVNGMNAGAYDATAINDMETVGNAQVSTAVSKFGGSSMAFDGTGDYLSIPSNNEITLGSGDFTIEFWVYLNSNSIVQLIYDQRNGQGAYPAIYMPNASIRYYVNSADRIIGGNLNTATWYHIAICRSGTSTRMFIDGTQSGSTYTDTTNYLAAPLFVGADKGPSSFMNGYIDDLRVTKGVARYTTTFTPPTQAFLPY